MSTEEKKLQTFLPDPFSPLGRTVTAGIGEALSDAAEMGSDALELIYGKKRADIIEDKLSNVVNFFDESLDKTEVGKATKQALQKSFYPTDLSPMQEVGKEIVSYVTPYTGVVKALKPVTKVIKKVSPRLEKGVRYGTAGVIADVIAKDENEQHLKPIMELVGAKGISEEVDDLVNKLDINPDDTVSERLLKQTIDSAGLSVALGIPLAVIFKVLKYSGGKALGKAKAIKNKVDTPVANTSNKIASDVKVVEQKPGKYLQQGKISSVLGKINTGLGRILTSKGAMPDELFKAYIKRKTYSEAKELAIKNNSKKLESVLKNASKGLNDADKQKLLDDTNELLKTKQFVKTGVKKLDGKVIDPGTIKEALKYSQLSSRLPNEIVDTVTKLRQSIDKESKNLKDLMGLSKNSKLGAVIDAKTSLTTTPSIELYLTKTYDFYTNPEWVKKLNKGLKEAKSFREGVTDNTHNTEVIDVINNMRTHLIKNNKSITENNVDGILDNFINDVTKKNKNSSGLFANIMDFTYDGKPIKVFTKRKNIDEPVANFLGEVKDPYRNYVETMRNLNKSVAKAQYLQDIKKFAEKYAGKDIKLGGFIPSWMGVPSQVSKIVRDSEIGTSTKLADLAKKEMGAIGSDGSSIGLGKYSTDDTLYKMIDEGIDVFDKYQSGNLFTNIFTRPAGYIQATETVFDQTAHAVNALGMLQTLIANGHILRGREAAKSAKTLYQKYANKDKDAMKFFEKAKLAAVVDTSVNAEIVRKNLNVLDEDLLARGSYKGKDLKEGAGLTFRKGKEGFRKFTKATADAYGIADDFGKLTALQAEIASYRKAFPNMSEDELFDYAAEVVRNTMHSYSTALPVVRALSRFPLGTYATFPAETLRTGKNIVIKGGQDFYNGISNIIKASKTGDKELFKTGLALAQIGSRRLSGAILAGVGLDYMFGNTDKDDIFGMGVSKEDSEGLDNLLSEWQQNTTKHFNTPIYESRDGNIYTKFVDGGALDTYAFIKDAAKAMYGAVLAGVNPEDTNIKDDFDVEFNKLVSPFISEKALTKRMLEIYQGRDEYGREINRLDSTSELFTKDLNPGFVKNIGKLWEDYNSEKHKERNELPIAGSSKGYPVVFEDTVFHNATGIRKQTMNITKAIGHFIYNQQQETKKPYENYIKTLKEFPTKVYTKEDELNILKAYADSQFEKRKLTKEFADRLNQIKEINYYKKVGDKVYKQKFGMNVIANANAKLGKRKIDKNLLFLLTDKGGAGYFKPDNPIDKKAREIIRDKKLPPEIMNKLIYIKNKFEGSALRKDIDNE